MEVDYRDHPEAWEEIAKPELLNSYDCGSTDSALTWVTLRPKEGEPVTFSRVPTSMFLILEAKFYVFRSGTADRKSYLLH